MTRLLPAIRRAPVAAASIAVFVAAAYLPLSSGDAATATCFGKALTQDGMGTTGDDIFITVDGQEDVIYAGEGDDVIVSEGEGGTGGDPGDYLCGGPGNDYIFGGDGPDHLRGGRDNDDVDGWRGADVIQGNDGDDKVADASIESNDDQNDIIRGGTGNDKLYGGWGADELFGGQGQDRLFDAECDGPTSLYGGLGADYLDSYRSSYEGWTTSYCDDRTGATPDSMTGGGGSDRAKVSRKDTVDTVEFVRRIRSAP